MQTTSTYGYKSSQLNLSLNLSVSSEMLGSSLALIRTNLLLGKLEYNVTMATHSQMVSGGEACCPPTRPPRQYLGFVICGAITTLAGGEGALQRDTSVSCLTHDILHLEMMSERCGPVNDVPGTSAHPKQHNNNTGACDETDEQ